MAEQVVLSDRVGEHLRRWRTLRGLSQLSVAVECGVSTRHLSFVETGRARPSSELIVHLARFLEPTNRELSVCLLSAGYAPVHVVALDAERALNATLTEMVDRHDPYPAFVFNADWMMERINLGGQWLCAVLMPGMWETIPDPHVGLDMIAGLIHPDGLLSRMRDPVRMGAAIVHQLRLEQLTNPRLEARVDALEQSLDERYPEHGLGTDRDPAEPSLHLDFDTPHGLLSFFTLQSVVGIPQHITVGSPRVEMWFPADLHTRTVIDRHVVPLERERPSRRPA